jgi:16S rRNA (cytosine1402-N4)-methyltransferase
VRSNGSDDDFGISQEPGSSHIPVMLREVLEYLNPLPEKNFIDCTGGPGGMSEAILDMNSPGRVLTLDCDPRARDEQDKKLSRFGDRSVRRMANFSEISEVASEEKFGGVDGILFDLGLSSGMVDCPEYGASIRHNAPLDMRMNPDLDLSAFDLVNTLSEEDLTNLFKGMDEHRWARRIARTIVEERRKGDIETTGQLADLIASAIPRRFHPKRIHPATRSFLALRVEVNQERQTLDKALRACPGLLAMSGVLVVICYSSFEDQVLRAAIRETRERWERLTRKAVVPGKEEIGRNPRSRSARLRAYRKAA